MASVTLIKIIPSLNLSSRYPIGKCSERRVTYNRRIELNTIALIPLPCQSLSCLLDGRRTKSRHSAEGTRGFYSGGMQDALVDPLNSALAHLSYHDNYAGIASDLNGMLIRSAECAGMSLEYLIMDPILGIIYESTGWSNPEENWYIYHSDHLGSSSFLTDASGDPTQHLQYMPFGETFVEQRSITSYYTPYTFSAKERDPETGYSYFGARYYSSDISVWLSVDPLADERSWLSPYNYCQWKPVTKIDPNGLQDELVIVGDMADFALEQLQNTTNLILSRDPITGKITSSGDPITEIDKKLFAIINDPIIEVVFNATEQTYSAGSCMGTSYREDLVSESHVISVKPFLTIDIPYTRISIKAFQEGNPLIMQGLETATKSSKGTGMLHEITEAYNYGEISKQLKRNLDKAWRMVSSLTGETISVSDDYWHYLRAHKKATKAPNE
jgi:RHS repeat-associated protein